MSVKLLVSYRLPVNIYRRHFRIICIVSGSLDLLEPCGPVQACNGIAFFLPFTFYHF
jgi:hypothetical protein